MHVTCRAPCDACKGAYHLTIKLVKSSVRHSARSCRSTHVLSWVKPSIAWAHISGINTRLAPTCPPPAGRAMSFFQKEYLDADDILQSYGKWHQPNDEKAA